MEFVDGESARDLLERLGRLAVADAVHVALDIARALEHAHSRNVVHRDIKPDNILITRSGVAKLADLGLAKRTDAVSSLTATKQGFGTPYYMPYEQAINARVADGRSDIYGLGATLYHLLTGQVPFPGDNAVEIVELINQGLFAPAVTHNAEVPASLDGVLARMLARDPEGRYQTASELIIDLERLGLAAVVPSFVDAGVALKDPVVRRQLNVPLAATQPDVQVRPEPVVREVEPVPGVWFLRYHDHRGHLCKARATTEQILKRLRNRRIPADTEVARQMQGPYSPVADIAEFQVLVRRKAGQDKSGQEQKRSPKPSRRAGPRRFIAWVLVGAAALILGGLFGWAVVRWLG
jgi:serine/threonine-protein kinase